MKNIFKVIGILMATILIFTGCGAKAVNTEEKSKVTQ